MTNKEQEYEFLGSTISMIAHHKTFEKAQLVRCHFYEILGRVELHACDDFLCRIDNVETVFISSDEYNERDLCYSSSLPEWSWAMKKLGFDFEEYIDFFEDYEIQE